MDNGPASKPNHHFPAGFLWGVASSSHQVEGGNLNNQWAAWEQKGRIKSGDHVVCGNDLYGGTPRLFNQVMSDFGIEFSYVDTTDASNVERAIWKNTRMVFVETPTNPLMRISDLAAISAICRRKKVDLVVDNTFISPYFQQPLALGAGLALSNLAVPGAAASAAGAGALTFTQPFHDAVQSMPATNPCTGAPGTVTITENGVFHVTVLTSGPGAGTAWATGTFTAGMWAVAAILCLGALLALCVRHSPALEKEGAGPLPPPEGE